MSERSGGINKCPNSALVKAIEHSLELTDTN